MRTGPRKDTDTRSDRKRAFFIPSCRPFSFQVAALARTCARTRARDPQKPHAQRHTRTYAQALPPQLSGGAVPSPFHGPPRAQPHTRTYARPHARAANPTPAQPPPAVIRTRYSNKRERARTHTHTHQYTPRLPAAACNIRPFAHASARKRTPTRAHTHTRTRARTPAHTSVHPPAAAAAPSPPPAAAVLKRRSSLRLHCSWRQRHELGKFNQKRLIALIRILYHARLHCSWRPTHAAASSIRGRSRTIEHEYARNRITQSACNRVFHDAPLGCQSEAPAQRAQPSLNARAAALPVESVTSSASNILHVHAVRTVPCEPLHHPSHPPRLRGSQYPPRPRSAHGPETRRPSMRPPDVRYV